jgi:DNA-binding transcriptional MerR regulator
MTISRAAEAAGVNPETIRFYEREGLIPQPPKPREGYRQYPPRIVERIRFIKHCQELGFTLKEARELITLTERASQGTHEACSRVEWKVAELDRKIEQLRAIRAALTPLLGCRAEENCRAVEALTGAARTIV